MGAAGAARTQCPRAERGGWAAPTRAHTCMPTCTCTCGHACSRTTHLHVHTHAHTRTQPISHTSMRAPKAYTHAHTHAYARRDACVLQKLTPTPTSTPTNAHACTQVRCPCSMHSSANQRMGKSLVHAVAQSHMCKLYLPPHSNASPEHPLHHRSFPAQSTYDELLHRLSCGKQIHTSTPHPPYLHCPASHITKRPPPTSS